MSTDTIARHDVRITISDSAGTGAKIALTGVTVFELARLRLPSDSLTIAAAESGESCGGCGGGCRACSPI
jgi:hypothetical protein